MGVERTVREVAGLYGNGSDFGSQVDLFILYSLLGFLTEPT